MNKCRNIPIIVENSAPPLDKRPALVEGDVSLVLQKKYSVPEASKLAGISQTNLRAIIKAGELRVIQILKTKMLILESDLESLLQSRYGIVRKEKIVLSRMPALPDFVANSKYLNRKAS